MRSALLWALLFAFAASAHQTGSDFADLSTQAARARDGNDIKSAIRLYTEALKLNPAWQEGWWMAGSLQYDSEQYADGAESLGHLVNLKPDAGPAWALLGLCEYEVGGYDRAFEGIKKALAIGVGDQPQMVAVLKFHKALLLSKKGEFEAALQLYSAFIPPTISDQQVLLGLGLAALRHANVPKEIPPQQADMFMLAGQAMAAFLTGQYAAAQISCDQMLARYSGNPDVHYVYGYFVLRTDPERAISEWKRTLSIDPSNAAALSMLSWAFWLQGDKEKALTYAENAVAKDPNSTTGQMMLGRLLVGKGQLATGIEHLERAARNDPTNLEAHLALATAYSEAGRKADSQLERQLCLKIQSEKDAVAQR